MFFNLLDAQQFMNPKAIIPSEEDISAWLSHQ